MQPTRQQELKITPKSFIRTLRIIHISMIAGPVLFFIVSGFLVTQNGHMGHQETSNIFFIVNLLLVAGVIIAGTIIPKKILNKANSPEVRLKSKMQAYQTASIVKWGPLEGSALFSAVAYLLTGSINFVIIGTVLLIFLASLAPNKTKFMDSIELSPDEQQKLDSPDLEIL